MKYHPITYHSNAMAIEKVFADKQTDRRMGGQMGEGKKKATDRWMENGPTDQQADGPTDQ